MKKFILLTVLAIISIGAACGAKTETTTGNKANSATMENKSSVNSNANSTTTNGAATAIVKDVYDDAMRRNCSAIPAKLTENFRKEVGTSKDELDALCDVFTDSGKLASFEIKGEELKADAGTVKVSLTFKDGKKEDKTENVKKSADGKWLLDS